MHCRDIWQRQLFLGRSTSTKVYGLGEITAQGPCSGYHIGQTATCPLLNLFRQQVNTFFNLESLEHKHDVYHIYYAFHIYTLFTKETSADACFMLLAHHFCSKYTAKILFSSFGICVETVLGDATLYCILSRYDAVLTRIFLCVPMV